MWTAPNTSSQPATSAAASIQRRRAAAKIAVASVSAAVTGLEPMSVTTLATLTSVSLCSRSATSKAMRSMRGYAVLRIASPISTKLKPPTIEQREQRRQLQAEVARGDAARW